MISAFDVDKKLTEMEDVLRQLNPAVDILITSKRIADKKIDTTVFALESIKILLESNTPSVDGALRVIEATLNFLR